MGATIMVLRKNGSLIATTLSFGIVSTCSPSSPTAGGLDPTQASGGGSIIVGESGKSSSSRPAEETAPGVSEIEESSGDERTEQDQSGEITTERPETDSISTEILADIEMSTEDAVDTDFSDQETSVGGIRIGGVSTTSAETAPIYKRYPFFTGFDFSNSNTDSCGYPESTWKQNYALHKISFGIKSVSMTGSTEANLASATFTAHAGWEDTSGKSYDGSWSIFHSNVSFNQRYMGIYEGSRSFTCNAPSSGQCTHKVTINTVASSEFQNILNQLESNSYHWASFVRGIEAEYEAGKNLAIKDLEYRISSEDKGAGVIEITLTTNMNSDNPKEYSGTFRYGLLIYDSRYIDVKTVDYDEGSDLKINSAYFRSDKQTAAYSFNPVIGNSFPIFSGIGFDRADSDYKATRLYQRASIQSVSSSKQITSRIESALHRIQSDGDRFTTGETSWTRTNWAARCDSDSFAEAVIAPEDATQAPTIRVVACANDTICKVDSRGNTNFSTSSKTSTSRSRSL
jgi:hypothetical protein